MYSEIIIVAKRTLFLDNSVIKVVFLESIRIITHKTYDKGGEEGQHCQLSLALEKLKNKIGLHIKTTSFWPYRTVWEAKIRYSDLLAIWVKPSWGGMGNYQKGTDLWSWAILGLIKSTMNNKTCKYGFISENTLQ